jgi:hypothetical protein
MHPLKQLTLAGLVATLMTSVTATPALAGLIYDYNTFLVSSGSTSNHVTGINNAGDVTGYYDPAGAAGRLTGFLLKADGTLSSVSPTDTYHQVEAFGINNSDTVSGYNDFQYNNGANSTDQGFIQTAGGTDTYANGPSTPPWQTYGYGINDSGVQTGFYKTSFGTYGYTFDGTTLTTLADPGNPGSTFAYGINDSGEIVGYYTAPGGVLHGFLRAADGTYSNIDDPNGTHGTEPQAINSEGDIAGYYLDGVNKIHGFVYLASDQSFQTIDISGGSTYIFGFNVSDQISGSYRMTSISDYKDFIGTPESGTPEPSTLLQLGGGLVAIGLRYSKSRSGRRARD